MNTSAARGLRALVLADLDEITERQPLPRCNLRAIHADATTHGEVSYQPSDTASDTARPCATGPHTSLTGS